MKRELEKPVSLALLIGAIVYAVAGLLYVITSLVNGINAAGNNGGVIVVLIIITLIVAAVIGFICFLLYKAHLYFKGLIGLDDDRLHQEKQMIANWSVLLLFLMLPIGAVSLIYYCSIKSNPDN